MLKQCTTMNISCLHALALTTLLIFAPGLRAQQELPASEPVKICYEYNAQPPYTFGDHAIPEHNPGLLVDLIDSTFNALPYQVKFYRRSWKRCMEELKNGQADATFAMIWTEERALWAQFPARADGALDPDRYLWAGTYSFFVHPDSPLSWDGHRLSQIKLGVGAPLGYISYERLKALNALSQITVDQKAGLEMVANQRMDGYVIDQAIGLYQMKQLGLENSLMSLPVPFMSSSWYLPFSKKYYQRYPERVEQIWDTLAQQRAKNSQQLLKRYTN